MALSRGSHRYRSVADEQAVLRMRLKDLAQARVSYGYRRLHVLLQREGWLVNHKRVYRLYSQEGLMLRTKRPRRHVSCQRRVDRPAAAGVDESWSMDFMSDELFDGRRTRLLTIVDNFTRESLAIKVAASIGGRGVVEVLHRLMQQHRVPRTIRVDHGPEFTSKRLDQWAYLNGVDLDFSRPGKPTDSAFIESLNGRFRQECLNENWFLSLEDAEEKVESWRRYSFSLTVPIKDDDLAEEDETFTVTLQNVRNAVLADGQTSITATGTIVDNEPHVSVSAHADEVTEGDPITFSVTRTGDTSSELTVVATVAVSAPGTFPLNRRRDVTFGPGVSTVTWQQPTTDDSVDAEPGGWVVVALPFPEDFGLPKSYWIAGHQAVVIANDNDLPTVTIEADHYDRIEGQDVTFTLTREGNLKVALAVDVSVTGGDDFITGTRPATVAFAQDASTASLTVSTENDAAEDEQDVVTAEITDDDYAVGSPGSAGVTLLDSLRSYPEVSISAENSVVTEGEDVVFTLIRSEFGLAESLTV